MVFAAGAMAHGGETAYDSAVTAVDPLVAGVTATVPGGGSHLELTNRSGRELVVEGYEGEPFARILADGTVQLNLNSPSYWLNKDVMGNAPVPPSASADARPRWRMQDRTATLDWHDHRVHWMSTAVPRQVRDRANRTKIQDWTVPMTVGGKPTTVKGTLWWRGESGGFPTVAVVAFGLLAGLVLGLAVILVMRRRGIGGNRNGNR
ncbi:MAG: hypothetical protein WCO96_06460 [Actinomycetes bacterium]